MTTEKSVLCLLGARCGKQSDEALSQCQACSIPSIRTQGLLYVVLVCRQHIGRDHMRRARISRTSPSRALSAATVSVSDATSTSRICPLSVSESSASGACAHVDKHGQAQTEGRLDSRDA